MVYIQAGGGCRVAFNRGQFLVGRSCSDNQLDGHKLQNELDTLSDWAIKWQMQYNMEKCKVVHCGKQSIGFTHSNEWSAIRGSNI